MKKGLLFIFVMAFIALNVSAQIVLSSGPNPKPGETYVNYSTDVQLLWHDGIYHLGYAWADGTPWLSAALFDVADLTALGVVGLQITEVIIHNKSAPTVLTIEIRSASGGTPGAILYEEVVTPGPEDKFNIYTLSTPFYIDGTTDITIGYSVEYTVGTWPVSADAVSDPSGKGDLCSNNGGASWLHMTDLGGGITGDILIAATVFQDTYTVTFNVDDGTTPIDVADISIKGGTYSTTAGTVDIELSEGTYTFTVTADGYDDYAGTYTVTTDAGQTAAVHMTEAISVKDVKAAGISIYPNPSNGVFNVNVESNFNLEVLDITGKVINTRVLTGNSTVEINTAGVYFLRFSNEEGSVTQRVIVQ